MDPGKRYVLEIGISDIPQYLSLPTILQNNVLLDPNVPPNVPSDGELKAYFANAVAGGVIPHSFKHEGTVHETAQLFQN